MRRDGNKPQLRGEILSPIPDMQVRALVVAGGFGTRLRPLTDKLPKPLLEVGGVSLLERILLRLAEAGIVLVTISVHYLADQIMLAIGNGSKFGLNVEYISEVQPLGTIGALGRMAKDARTIVVTNADIISDLNFAEIVAFHFVQKASMTVAVSRYVVPIPFGCVTISDDRIVNIQEKPTYEFWVAGGVYCVDAAVRRLVTGCDRLDVPELMSRAMDQGLTVRPFESQGKWLDVGDMASYQKAQESWRGGH